MNSLYTVVRTLIVFVFGTGSIFFLNANLSFAINLIIMVILAYFIYGAMFKKTKYNVLYILLIGTVLTYAPRFLPYLEVFKVQLFVLWIQMSMIPF